MDCIQLPPLQTLTAFKKFNRWMGVIEPIPKDTFFFSVDKKLVGIVEISPLITPYVIKNSPSNLVASKLLVMNPRYLGPAFRAFYRVYPILDLIYPVHLFARPETTEGMSLDTRLGFRPDFNHPPLYSIAIPTPKKWPLIRWG